MFSAILNINLGAVSYTIIVHFRFITFANVVLKELILTHACFLSCVPVSLNLFYPCLLLFECVVLNLVMSSSCMRHD